MKIGDVIKARGSSLSFEFFPPKDAATEDRLFQTITTLKGYGPTFVSVTYGAGGGTLRNTRKVILRLKEDTSLTPTTLQVKKPADKAGILATKLAAACGSYEGWEQDFKATGAMRGIGWVILYQDNTNGWLFNQWINEHEVGHPAGCAPILVMDVFEHAFMLDYGLKRADYISAFFQNIDWDVVVGRLK